MPAVSVAIPCLNVAATLADQLAALARQQYASDWEVLIVDDGSTDATTRVAEEWSGRLPVLRILRQPRRLGIAAARNRALREASGERLLACDGDDVVAEGWLAALAGALDDCDLVGGLADESRLNDTSLRQGECWPSDRLPTALGYLPFAVGCNFGIRIQVARALGGWDETLANAEDIDLSWRAQLAGYHLAFEPRAVVAYRHRDRAGEIWRKSYRAGAGRRELYARYRDRLRANDEGGGPLSAARGVAWKGVGLALGLPLLAISRRKRITTIRWLAYAAGWLTG